MGFNSGFKGLNEHLRKFYCCRQNKFCHKNNGVQHLIFLYYFTLRVTSTIRREGIVAFPLEQWLLKRAQIITLFFHFLSCLFSER